MPIKAIAPGNATTGKPGADFSGLVVKDPAITSPKQLVGKKVAATLGDKLGPVLFQLPPNFKKAADRLRALLAAWPAERRIALEFRHESWFDDEVYSLMRARNAALCVAETEEGRSQTPVDLERHFPVLPDFIKRQSQIILPSRHREGHPNRATRVPEVAILEVPAPEPSKQILDLVERLYRRRGIIDRRR